MNRNRGLLFRREWGLNSAAAGYDRDREGLFRSFSGAFSGLGMSGGWNGQKTAEAVPGIRQ